MKKTLVSLIFGAALSFSFANAQHSTNSHFQMIDERSDIANIVKELDYLIDVTKNMKNKYKNNNNRITFNYDALINQLQTTRNRTAEYLNTQGQQINAAPPISVDSDLLRLKK